MPRPAAATRTLRRGANLESGGITDRVSANQRRRPAIRARRASPLQEDCVGANRGGHFPAPTNRWCKSGGHPLRQPNLLVGARLASPCRRYEDLAPWRQSRVGRDHRPGEREPTTAACHQGEASLAPTRGLRWCKSGRPLPCANQPLVQIGRPPPASAKSSCRGEACLALLPLRRPCAVAPISSRGDHRPGEREPTTAACDQGEASLAPTRGSLFAARNEWQGGRNRMCSVEPRRKPLRLRHHDYSKSASYFVTVCCHDREPLLGSVIDARVEMTAAGRLLEAAWHECSERWSTSTDGFVVMPDHWHGILHFETTNSQETPRRRTLGRVVGGIKALAARRINLNRGTEGAPVWQRGYYEHVLRGEADLDRARRYILENPARWSDPGRVQRPFESIPDRMID